MGDGKLRPAWLHPRQEGCIVSSSASSAHTLQTCTSRDAHISAPADAGNAGWWQAVHLPRAKCRHVRWLRLRHSGVDYHEAALRCRAGKVGSEAQAVQHTTLVGLRHVYWGGQHDGWSVAGNGKQAQRSTAQPAWPTLRQTFITSAWRALILSFLPAA